MKVNGDKLLLVCLGLAACSLADASRVSASPWWDAYPTFMQSGDTGAVLRAGAAVGMCAVADDPAWGVYGQRAANVNAAGRAAALREAGIRNITWFEGFGQGMCYLAQVKRGSDGRWLKHPRDPDLTQIFRNHWGWQDFDGMGELRWVGVQNFFEDADFARPFTRANPAYACPPMTYPDGRVAAGYAGDASDPRNSRVFDAGCCKDVLGRLAFDYHANPSVTRIDPATKRPHGPLTGLLETGETASPTPDPGFTPAEWAALKKTSYASCLSVAKDIACPVWNDYLKVTVKEAVRQGVDGLWVDNYSAWDSLNAQPIRRAFGDWSVARFNAYLATRCSSRERAAMGVPGDTASFSVRDYLQSVCRAWGGDPSNFNDPKWRDPRWQKDPVWRAYLICLRQCGAEGLSGFYRVAKAAAKEAGNAAFLLTGNDIPGFSLGWVRGDLDMVSTELSWGWGLTTGSRGLMPPPRGSYVPVYKLAREHARSRFVNVWQYVPKEQLGRTNIANVLYYQGLANHTFPMPHADYLRTAGNPATDAAFNLFVRSVAPVFGDRVPVERVGVYYSSSSQLMELLPGGFRNHADQTHSFAFWGWGTALGQLHMQWRAVPEWKLTADMLRGLRTLIVPCSEILDADAARLLEPWLRKGGTLIVTGQSGVRLGDKENFEVAAKGPVLSALCGDAGQPRRLGKGVSLYLKDDPGLAFYRADKERQALLGPFRQFLASLSLADQPSVLTAPDVPATVGLTLYRSGSRLFVDVNNTDIDLANDRLTPTPPVTFKVSLPPELRGKKWQIRTLSPDAMPHAKIVQSDSEQVTVKLDPVSVYASVVVEPVSVSSERQRQ